MSALDDLATKWEAEAQGGEHMAVVSETLLRCARELREAAEAARRRLIRDIDPKGGTTRKLAQEQAQTEQLVLLVEQAMQPVPCVRCGRKLLHPEWLNGAPFGRVCYRKEALGE